MLYLNKLSGQRTLRSFLRPTKKDNKSFNSSVLICYESEIFIALAVFVLFGLATLIVNSSRDVSADSNVRICPTTGLPCDGNGLCNCGNGEPCGGCASESDCCESKTTASASEGADCANCPSSVNGICSGKTAASKESAEK